MKRLAIFSASLILALGWVSGLQAHASINLSLAATATANSSYLLNVPANAIDGDLTTIWNAGGHGSSASPNWIMVDLGAVKNVKSVYVFWDENDGSYAGYTNVYKFYTRLPDSEWMLQTSGVFVDESADPADREFTLDFGVSGLDMRYAKYEVDGGSHWSAVSEIQIFGDGGANGNNVVPEPATIFLFGTGLIGAALRKRF